MPNQRRKWRRVDGVLLLDKPVGASSNAALQRARRLYEAERAGHTGTLDPMASGLLVLCLGDATKFSAELLEADKHYEARLKLGIKTTTGDAEGEVVEERPMTVSEGDLQALLPRYSGEIEQVPPMYSALKRNGRPLYEYARKGEEVERAARIVKVHSLTLTRFAGDEAELSVSCSKGTYIRTLAEDLGEALGCGAHLTALRRTAIGDFRLEDAVTLDELEPLSPEERLARLKPADSLIRGVPEVGLDLTQQQAYLQGQALRNLATVVGPGRTRVYGPGRQFLGVGLVDSDGILHPKRVLNLR